MAGGNPNNTETLGPVAPETTSAPVDATLDVIVSDDLQSAYAGVRAPQNGGNNLPIEEIVRQLAARKVTSGLLMESIAAMAKEPEYGKMKLVAQGELPKPGVDASLEYYVEITHELRPKERENGTVDYRDLGLITSVKAGDRLCTLTPSIKGTPGRTVTGKLLLPPTVRNLVLPAGKNTVLSEDKLTLLAQINGCVDWQNGRLSVLNLFTVRGDVGNTTGNIDFDGSVVVTGDVTSGFTVKATGRIDVMGHVEAARIVAGSDIKLMGGFAGQGRGVAECGGNFKALFIENAEVTAGGDITADVVMHSRVKSSGSLIAEGRHGALIGGNIVVARDIKAQVIGSPNAIVTNIELGSDPGRIDRMKEIDERLKSLDKEITKLQQIIHMLTPLMNTGKLPPDRVDMLNKAIVTHDASEHLQTQLAQERETLRREVEEVSTSQLICKKELYSGTKISISGIPYVVTGSVSRCKLYLNQQKEVTLISI